LTDQKTEMIIQDLIGRMTLEEKVSMCHGAGLFRTEGIERLGIPPLQMSDGPNGIRAQFHNSKWEHTGLTFDAVSYLPANSALAATWNTELAYTGGKVLGCEARGRGKDVILAPGINIMRNPLCGRNYEYMSEDPYLVSRMAVPFIKGIQEQGVSACVKHFAMNSQEIERLKVDVETDERSLYEIYLPGFKAAVTEGGTYSIMSAYNKFRGSFCSHSEYLLKKILKDEWNFDGVVISDWGAVHDTKAPAENGLDIEMNVTNNFDEYFFANPLIDSVKKGLIDESVIDEKVKRILGLMYKIGIFSDNRLSGTYNMPEHRAAAYKTALESVVLLKNEGHRLPLDAKAVKSILVIGDNADHLQAMPGKGGDSGEVKALYEITPLTGLMMRLGGGTKVQYVRGYSEQEEKKQELLEEAVLAAKTAETVIVFGGINRDFDKEGRDRADMKLPYGQDELISKLLEANQNTIVVMTSGSPLDMSEWIEKAPTVVQGWYSGMETGYALAGILLGDASPSGKLPFTIPKKYEDSPSCKLGEYPGNSVVHYNEGIFTGYRYYDTLNVEPLFCFGHGLSYTSFKYSNLKIGVKNADAAEFLVTMELTNTGDTAGAEVVQLYLSDTDCSFDRPAKELKAFKKVCLKPNETQVVELILDRTSFAFYNDVEKLWVCEKGSYDFLVGSSSRDIRLQSRMNLDQTMKYK
jgi:beta-glucosidase